MSATPKYTLRKVERGVVRPCAFFSSPQGCRQGAKCKFAHGEVAAVLEPKNESSSVISSEDDADNHDDMFVSPPSKKKHHESAASPFESKTLDAKRKRSKKNASDVAPKSPLNSAVAKMADAADDTPRKKNKTLHAAAAAVVAPPQTPNFRDLGLPVAAFSCFGDGRESADSSGSDDESPRALSAPEEPEKRQLPLPRSTLEGLKWQRAVVQTRSHPKYDIAFDFERFKTPSDGDAWVSTLGRAFGPWCASNPHAIAIDCEMCETKCPTTGAIDSKALCRLSVVNALDPDEVLLDTLVMPDWPVVDYRSFVNGIRKEHLDDVKFTLRHAQAFMMALCSEETVIIGQAVHNDLMSLKMEHHCNVDSSFLFPVKDSPNATCSLKNLAMGVLKREMPDTHDSVNDARVALMCLEEGYVKTCGVVEPVEQVFAPKRHHHHPHANRRTTAVPKEPVDPKILATELLVHRIPRDCTTPHITSMMIQHTSIQPREVGDIEFTDRTGKCIVTFSTAGHAQLAFDAIGGDGKEDMGGFLQKRVYLKKGGHVCVRQMVRH